MTDQTVNEHIGADALHRVLSELSAHHVEVVVEHGIVVARMRGSDAHVAAEVLKGKLS